MELLGDFPASLFAEESSVFNFGHGISVGPGILEWRTVHKLFFEYELIVDGKYQRHKFFNYYGFIGWE